MRSESRASLILRSKLRSLVSRKFFATCWVMVEAPCMCLSPCTSTMAARGDAFGIDAVMGVEILVFGRDKRLLDQRRDGVGRQVEPTLMRIFGEQEPSPAWTRVMIGGS